MTVERVQTAMPKSFHFTLVFIFQQVIEQNKSLLAIVFHKKEPLLGRKKKWIKKGKYTYKFVEGYITGNLLEVN